MSESILFNAKNCIFFFKIVEYKGAIFFFIVTIILNIIVDSRLIRYICKSQLGNYLNNLTKYLALKKYDREMKLD